MYSVCYDSCVELYEDIITEVSKAFLHFYLYSTNDEYHKYVNVVSHIDINDLLESDGIYGFYCFYIYSYSVFVFNDNQLAQSEIIEVFKQKSNIEEKLTDIVHNTDIVILYAKNI